MTIRITLLHWLKYNIGAFKLNSDVIETNETLQNSGIFLSIWYLIQFNWLVDPNPNVINEQLIFFSVHKLQIYSSMKLFIFFFFLIARCSLQKSLRSGAIQSLEWLSDAGQPLQTRARAYIGLTKCHRIPPNYCRLSDNRLVTHRVPSHSARQWPNYHPEHKWKIRFSSYQYSIYLA